MCIDTTLRMVDSFYTGELQIGREQKLGNQLPLIERGNYIDYNNMILESFTVWLKKNTAIDSQENFYSITKDHPRVPEFLRAMEREFEDGRQLMQERFLAILRERILWSETFEEILFNNKYYTLVALLGEKVEGKVYLVKNHKKYFVIKQFKKPKPLEKHIKILRFLENKGVSSAKVISVVREENSLMLTYEHGITTDEVFHGLVVNGQLPEIFIDAYLFHHLHFVQTIIGKYGEQITALTGDKNFFTPHNNNVSYDPLTDRWSIFDVH